MKTVIAFASLLLALSTSTGWASSTVSTDFVNAKGEKIGMATLSDMENGTLISIDLRLPEGTHAMHIHENGKCDAPDFKTAGGHFNPGGDKHGFANKEGFHAGDLPNLFVESTGHIKAEIFSTHLHLSGKDNIGHGTAIIIHEKADNYTSDPSGNAGTRIACAVIKK